MQVQPSCLLFLMTIIAFFNIKKLTPETPNPGSTKLSKLPCITCKEITFVGIPNLQGGLVAAATEIGMRHGPDFEVSLVSVINRV